MGWIETGTARTRAAASRASAELADTNRRLPAARAALAGAGAIDDTVRAAAATRLGRAAPIDHLLAALQTHTAALRAEAQADVDTLVALRVVAEQRLRMAESSHRAMLRLAEERDRAKATLAAESDRLIGA